MAARTAVRELIRDARRAAAAHLTSAGRIDEASIVLEGGGDDFGEVRAAYRAISDVTERIERLERALGCYADPTFWCADSPEAALAFHDQGEIARSALNGKELYALHRD